MSRPPIAIAHDFLTVRGGSERVALALARAFPEAELHTSLHNPETTFPDFADVAVRTGPLDRVARFRRDHRLALPFIPAAFRATTVDADIVICSSAGFSHHVRTTGTKIVYCHTPARWLHDRQRYAAGWGPLVRAGATALKPMFAPLDRAAMREASRVIANSEEIAAEIADIYDLEAIVVPPCSSLSITGEVEAIRGVEPGFVLCPSRALGYKRLDVLVEAARELPELQFLHVGDGPHLALLEGAPANVRSVGAVDDAQLRWAYQHARSVAITCAEDFGLVPMEAYAHGLTSVVPLARGLIGHTAVAESGLFYEFGSARSLVAALRQAAPPARRALHPERLGLDRFVDAISAQLTETVR